LRPASTSFAWPGAFSEAAALVNPKIKLHVDEELRLGHHEDPAFAVHAAQVHAFYRPDYPPVWRDLAAALGAAGDKDGAAASDAIARDVAAGELSGAQLERPVREVARIGQVIDRLKISLRDGSHEANTARWFIRRLLANGYADLAAELLEAVLPTRPNDGRLWALSALVNEKLDRLPMACDAARRAADLLPELPEARLVLARILKRAGDPDAERELAAAARAFKRKGALPKTSPGRNG
jgi:tetratricopeptide (TPR) repeat protein